MARGARRPGRSLSGRISRLATTALAGLTGLCLACGSRVGPGPAHASIACVGSDETLDIRGRLVEICHGDSPADTRLAIDGIEVPLVYHGGFEGYGAPNLFGFFRDLRDLASAVIAGNPRLEFGAARPEP